MVSNKHTLCAKYEVIIVTHDERRIELIEYHTKYATVDSLTNDIFEDVPTARYVSVFKLE